MSRWGPLSLRRYQQCNPWEVHVPHPSYRCRAQRDMTRAQQEGLVIKAGRGYEDAITLADDQSHKHMMIVFSASVHKLQWHYRNIHLCLANSNETNHCMSICPSTHISFCLSVCLSLMHTFSQIIHSISVLVQNIYTGNQILLLFVAQAWIKTWGWFSKAE